MKQEIITYTPKKQTVLERINQKETVFLCVNEETQEPMFGTPSRTQAQKFARLNKCFISEYPPKTYTEE